MKKAVIYSITMPNGKKYIGVTENFYRRKIDHKTKWKNKARFNDLYDSFDVFGFEEAKWDILEECNFENRFERESFYISKFDTFKNGLNGTAGGQGGAGIKHTKSRERKRLLNLRKSKPRFFVENKKTGQCLGLWDDRKLFAETFGHSKSAFCQTLKNPEKSKYYNIYIQKPEVDIEHK